MTDTERERINGICEVAGVTEIDDLSDGFHTFRQLYYQRMILFAAIVRQNKDKAWKSLRHEDGELCFGGGWFIVGIDTPEGSYTYHYENKYFDLFDCEILDYSKHWDGHTEKDVTRLLSLPVQPNHIAESDRKVSISCAHENDLVFREAAIEALARMMPRSYTPDGSHPADEEIFRAQEVFADCIEALEILPSAQPATNCSEIPNGSDDTISRKAAIDALDIAIERYDEIAEKYRKKADIERNDYMDMRDNAYEAQQLAQWLNELKYLREKIEQITIKPEQRWIPVTERLPEHGGRYLVSVLDGINRRTTVAPYMPRCKAWTMTGRMTYWKVIAWMPLPASYKGE